MCTHTQHTPNTKIKGYPPPPHRTGCPFSPVEQLATVVALSDSSLLSRNRSTSRGLCDPCGAAASTALTWQTRDWLPLAGRINCRHHLWLRGWRVSTSGDPLPPLPPPPGEATPLPAAATAAAVGDFAWPHGANGGTQYFVVRCIQALAGAGAFAAALCVYLGLHMYRFNRGQLRAVGEWGAVGYGGTKKEMQRSTWCRDAAHCDRLSQ